MATPKKKTVKKSLPVREEILSEITRKDGEVFRLGDHVTNGTRMNGRITRIEKTGNDVYVYTTWSGIGMNLDSLSRVATLPSQHQLGDNVWYRYKARTITEQSINIQCAVIGVHFYPGKVKYDLEYISPSTRVYNIDSPYVVAV